MISRMFGAPFGGTTRGAHHGFDCRAPCLITPPNFGSGGGSCFPLMVAVALGEPGAPVICCAPVGAELSRAPATETRTKVIRPSVFIVFAPSRVDRLHVIRHARLLRMDLAW
jgi:hypothetical protein